MIFIEHRINTKEKLFQVHPLHGAEIDLRSDPESRRIYLHHDPFVRGESFEPWLDLFVERGLCGPLILNTKEDGLEEEVLGLLKRRNIENFFFLDTALPTLVKWTYLEKRFACRLSEYEPIESVLRFAGKAEWLWVDCFGGRPLPIEDLDKVKELFKICLVSPELHGVSDFDPRFVALSGIADAICTKMPQLWQIPPTLDIRFQTMEKESGKSC